MVKQYTHRIGLATALVVGTTTAFQASVVVPSSSLSSSSFLSKTTPASWQQHQPRRAAASQLNLLPEQGGQLAAAFHAACGKVEGAKESQRNDQAVAVSKVTTINKSSDVEGGIPSSSSASSPPSITPLSAARAFVARLFSLPSSRIRRHPHPKAEGFTEDFNELNRGRAVGGTSNGTTAAAAASTAGISITTKVDDTISKNVAMNTDDDDTVVDDDISDQDDVVLYPMVGFTFFQSKEDGSCTALPTTSHPCCRIPVTNKQEEVYGWFSPACELDIFAEDPSLQPANMKGNDVNDQAMVDITTPLN